MMQVVNPTRYLQLPMSFDVERLQADLASVEQSEWIAHFNTRAYENSWSCIPLRSVGGRIDNILPLDGAAFEDTVILERCPYFRQVIDGFQCEKTSIRLMSLEAGGIIREHRDDGASLEDGVTRLHVPIVTSPEVVFRIDGEEVHFSAGATWYLNASCLHAVENRGPAARIHLMIDCISNEWLESIFRSAGWVAREASKYGDPMIRDDNVDEVIASLRMVGSVAAHRMADSLQAMADVGTY
ncbi:MAG: aspartyl/asparaginyl beta-hydroxylase domain-containing protein [Ramlibacter sp.]|nr:aspartyl/asparaginyl beta-hydroxylase domain-containing protein [Ramlibacter sp.]